MNFDSTTSWTPAHGDIVGWPFVWRMRGEQEWKDRACLCLTLKDSEVLLFALTNPHNAKRGNYREIFWENFGWPQPSRSYLALHNLQVNVVGVRDVPEYNMKGDLALYGRIPPDNIRDVQRAILGGLLAGTFDQKPIVGVRRVAATAYQHVRLDVSPTREIYVRDEKGQTYGIV